MKRAAGEEMRLKNWHDFKSQEREKMIIGCGFSEHFAHLYYNDTWNELPERLREELTAKYFWAAKDTK